MFKFMASACERTVCRNTEDYNYIALITDIKQCNVIVSFWYTGPLYLTTDHMSLLFATLPQMWAFT